MSAPLRDTEHGRYPLAMVLTLLGLGIPAVLDPGAVGRAAALFRFGETPTWYFVPSHAFLLYLWFPLVALSGTVLLLTPGMLLASAMPRVASPGRWLLNGFCLSIPVVTLLGAAGSSGRTFALEVFGLSLALAALLAPRLRSAPGNSAAWAGPASKGTLTVTGAGALALFALFAPKFLWESFNGDGAHAYESARLLLHQPVPFWHESAGYVAGFPGLNSVLFALPGSWFLRLFGELEAAARIPAVLYLGLIYLVLLALIDSGRAQPLSRVERLLVGLPMLAFFLTMAYSATYDPYSADIALPFAQDALLMVCYLGFLLGFLERRGWAIVVFGVLSFLSSANGLLLLGFWMVAVWLVSRPRPWRELGLCLAAVATAFVLGMLLPRLLAALGQPAPGKEHTLVALLRHFIWLQATDWRRVLFIAVPCGLIPLAGFARLRGEDRITQALALVTLMQFGFFYFQAYTSLHYYVPSMVLPVAVFWRQAWVSQGAGARTWRRVVLAGGVVSLVLAAPVNWRPISAARTNAQGLAVRVPGYERSAPEVFLASQLLDAVFPLDFRPEVPAVYGGSPLAWIHYASPLPEAGRPINYVLQPRSAAPPEGMRLLDTNSVAAVYVGDEARWQADRALHPPSPAGARVFAIPRGMFFPSVPLPDGPHIFDIPAILTRLGVDVPAIRRRLEHKP